VKTELIVSIVSGLLGYLGGFVQAWWFKRAAVKLFPVSLSLHLGEKLTVKKLFARLGVPFEESVEEPQDHCDWARLEARFSAIFRSNC
jgi:hypothetical protein